MFHISQFSGIFSAEPYVNSQGNDLWANGYWFRSAHYSDNLQVVFMTAWLPFPMYGGQRIPTWCALEALLSSFCDQLHFRKICLLFINPGSLCKEKANLSKDHFLQKTAVKQKKKIGGKNFMNHAFCHREHPGTTNWSEEPMTHLTGQAPGTLNVFVLLKFVFDLWQSTYAPPKSGCCTPEVLGHLIN